jgi:DNA-binding response OmpR family regulator
MKILVVEDQESISKLIKEGLEVEGFSVDCVFDGEAAQTRIELSHEDYDVILLDIMLPKKSGLEVCRAVRQMKINTPIIMLTAKDTSADVVNGLNFGADDYILKPFTFEVLVARIRAAARRPAATLPVRLQAQDLFLDTSSKTLTRAGQEIRLTLKEFSLLEYLMRNPNRVLKRDQIISNVWDLSFDSFSNIVDVHITNIRKKINDQAGKILETVHGVGYKVNA